MNIEIFGFARARRTGWCLSCSCADVVEICMSRTRKTFRKLRSPNRETLANPKFEANRLERQHNDLMALKMRGYATMQVLCIAASRMPRLCKAPTRNLCTPDRDLYQPVPLWTQQENGKYNLGLLYANITSALEADSHRKTWSYRGNAAEAFRRGRWRHVSVNADAQDS